MAEAIKVAEITAEKKEKDLFAAVNYFRLKKDLSMVEAEMIKNQPFSSDSKKGIISNLWNKKVLNATRKKTTNKLSEVKKKILEETEFYKEAASRDGADISAGENDVVLGKALEEYFADDKYGLRKLYFGIRVILSKDVKFNDRDKTLEEVSSLLFNDRSKLKNIEQDLSDNYVAIFKRPMNDIEKGIMIGMGIFAAVSVAALPVGLALGASSSAIVTSCLAQLGHAAEYVIGPGMLKVTSAAAIASVLLLGTGYMTAEIVKACKINNIKKVFRKVSAKDLSMIFAVKATIIQHALKVVSEDSMKEVLDDCLKQINDLRSDAEYMLIVEKINARESREKISVCNRLSQRLADIVGI